MLSHLANLVQLLMAKVVVVLLFLFICIIIIFFSCLYEPDFRRLWCLFLF